MSKTAEFRCQIIKTIKDGLVEIDAALERRDYFRARKVTESVQELLSLLDSNY